MCERTGGSPEEHGHVGDAVGVRSRPDLIAPWGLELPPGHETLSSDELGEWVRARLGRRRFLASAAAVTAGVPMAFATPALGATAPVDRVRQAFGDDPNEFLLSWATPGSVRRPTVDVGTTTKYGRAVVADSYTFPGFAGGVLHRARIRKLRPGTRYRFRIRTSTTKKPRGGVTGTFRTPPTAPRAFTFTTFGDQGEPTSNGQTGKDGALVVRHALDDLNARRDLAFVLVNGDLAYSCNTFVPAWDAYMKLIAPVSARVPWMASYGNHEVEPAYTGTSGLGAVGHYGPMSSVLAHPQHGLGAGVPQSFYGFRYGTLQVVCLDANLVTQETGVMNNKGLATDAQRSWLERTLAAARAPRSGIDWIVASYHHCSYCTASLHASDDGPRTAFGPLFDRFGVDLVVNGHNHDYERTFPLRAGTPTRAGTAYEPAKVGTTYVVCGGGGNTLYPFLPPGASYVNRDGNRVPESVDWSARREEALSYLRVHVKPASGADPLSHLYVEARRSSPSGAPAVIETVDLRRRPGGPATEATAAPSRATSV